MSPDPLLAEYQIVAIEGCDGTGKTTLARTLAEGGFTVVHSPRTPDDVDLLGRYRHILATPGRLVLDRCFVSELVYGPLYRQRSRLSWPDAEDLAQRLSARDGVFVHLTGQAAAVHARLLARDRATPDLAEINRLIAAYHQVFAALAAHAPVIQRDLPDRRKPADPPRGP